ncbi:MAG TPA: hypothetical protein PLQ76_08740, partial [bacterium]|nr:hypothetical protein [bacterium]
GDALIEFASRVESRVNERDKYFEEGVRSILNNIEKAASRGIRGDIENLFGGGGLFSNIFGSQKSDSPMKLTQRTAGKGPGSLQDSQLRRFAYLTGKKINKNIIDEEGNVIATRGQTVDEEMIRTACEKQKTLELIRSVDLNG